ncbi:BID domain-containing T4SS effector [Bartonella sp. B35(2025)]
MEKKQTSNSPSVSSLRSVFEQQLHMQQGLNEGGPSQTQSSPEKPPEHVYAKVQKKTPVDSQTKKRSTGRDQEPVYASLDFGPKGTSQTQDRSAGRGTEPVYASLDFGATGDSQSRGRSTERGPTDTIYTEVSSHQPGGAQAKGRSTERGPTDTIYTEVSSHQPGGAQAKGRSTERGPTDTIYTEVSSHQPGGAQAKGRSTERGPTDTIYTEVSSHQPGASQARGRSAGGQKVETVYATAGFPVRRGPLSDHEIIERVGSREEVRYGMEEVRYWCKMVYGNPNVLQGRLEQIVGHPAVGEALSWRIAESPETIDKFAGNKTLGIKSGTRKTAEESILPLCQALDRYVEAIKKAHRDVHREHHTQQKGMGGLEHQSPKKPENIKQTKDVERHGHHHGHHHHHRRHDRSPSADRSKGGFAMTG